jgi:hypothetical protein
LEIATHVNPQHPTGTPVQPALAGLELGLPAAHPAPAIEARPAERAAGRLSVVPAPEGRRARRRYWSIRDVSRRLWLGRGYELLRELIRAGILPATRSSRSWWIDDADVRGLLEAFDARAGKVRAFRRVDDWLRERCLVAPLSPELEALLAETRTGLAWRGHAYLPKPAWTAATSAAGQTVYHHRSGSTIAPGQPLAA